MQKLLRHKLLLVFLRLLLIVVILSSIFILKFSDQTDTFSVFYSIAKLVCYGSVFLSIPTIVLRKQDFVFNFWFASITIWAFFITYPLFYAIFFLIILFVYPTYKMIKTGNLENKRALPNYSYIFVPLSITAIIVSILTKELIWIYGSATMFAWGLVSVLQRNSTGNLYNLIAYCSNDNKTTIKKWRETIIYIFLICSFFLPYLLEGNVVSISYWFTSINSRILELSLALVAIFIALQSLINRNYSGQTLKDRVFEARLNIESMRAIKGVISLFIMIVCFSILAFVIKNSFIDISFSRDLLYSPIISYEIFSPLALTLFYFSFIISFLLLSVYQIYFVFISGELIALPHKIFIKYNPIIIEDTSLNGVDNNNNNNNNKLDNIKNYLLSCNQLNGLVVNHMACTAIDYSKPHELTLTFKLEVLITEKQEIIDNVINLALCAMKDKDIIQVNIWVTTMIIKNIFSVDIDREKEEILREKLSTKLSIDEKVEILKPFICSHPFKESYFV